ncbi:dihydrofolate reductase family protein [Undibacterium squillarum]|uniref:Dihydrofolate reductase n=1 Tax=Undibacterium squillarum TaxID=1131567 RepID=A0ABQ2Y1G4_9BURK|nr:dihydrofolate reductase family protein [Undibacterium squillarum]GGX48174.1 dihydrofolate reductase [Undibacterium squillarum]
MTASCSVFAAISLDGFFAREDGSLDWLANVASGSRDYGYQQYLTSVDATLMSVRDMTSLLSGGFSLPRNCFVYAEQPLPDAESANLPTSVRLIQADAANALQQISTNGIQNIAAEGSEVIRALLADGLISRMTLTLAPVLLGKGMRLFGELTEDQYWQLQSHQAFDDGMVQLHYEQSL